MSSHVARRIGKGAATATAGLTAAALLVGGLAGISAAAPERTARTAVDSTYLQDALGVQADTRIESVTYNRLNWLLGQPGQFAIVVGSTNDTNFKTRVQQVDAAAKAANVGTVYWFDPNLSGYTGLRNLDTRNPAGITSINATSQGIYGDTWKSLLAQFLGNGYKASGVGTGKITIAADDTVVNDTVDPIWDYRTGADDAPVGSSDDIFFVYDQAGKVADSSPVQRDTIRSWVNLSGTAPVEPVTWESKIGDAIAVVGGANIDSLGQFQWWQSENNRILAAESGYPERVGSEVLADADGTDGWNVKQLTYQGLLHLLDQNDAVNDPNKNFAILFGGTWCPNTRAVIKDVNKQARANGVTVYNFDTILDGGLVGGGNTGSNPLQTRNNADVAVSGVTKPTYTVPSYLYGDLVKKYFKNLVTEYDPHSQSRVLYYPGGDNTLTADVVRRLQVPFLLNYERGTGGNPSNTTVKRQWIQQNTDASTGLPTFKEYMSQFWFTNPANTRLGITFTEPVTITSNSRWLPLEIAIPASKDVATTPDSALLTAAEKASSTIDDAERANRAKNRRNALTDAYANVAFGQEAVAKLKTFFAGLPGAVVSTQTVTASKVVYGTAPKVNVAIANPYGRVPAGPVKLTVAGKQYTVNAARNAASFTLPKLAPGAYRYTVSYTTDDEIVGFSKTGTLTVTKAKVSKIAGAVVKAPTSKKSGSYKVTVSTPKGLSKASGKVTVTVVKGKTTKRITATLKSGAATVTLPKLAKGTWKVTVRYAGDARYVSGTTAGKAATVKK